MPRVPATSYAFGVTYDGAGFHGWQRQKNLPTVQAALETAVSEVANHPISIRCAGRTDAGVHATGQVAAFSSTAERSSNQWCRGMNALTPDSIHVDWVVEVEDSFHPRYNAAARRYVYLFYDTGHRHPLLRHRVWSCAPLDVDTMHQAAQVLLGEHDFSSFRAAGCQARSPVRRVNKCAVTRHGAFVVLEIDANAFLLHMVRNLASALHAEGCNIARLPLAQLLAAKDRSQLGPTAPPDGLYLVAVSYPDVELPQAQGIPFLL